MFSPAFNRPADFTGATTSARSGSTSTCKGEPDNAFYFIANLHALTTVRDRQALAQYTLDAAIDLLALGLDPEPGHAVRAVRRARGLRTVLAADDRHADGPAGTLPRLQGQEGEGTDGRRRPVHLSRADGGRHSDLRFRHRAGRRGPGAAHRGLPRSGRQLQPPVRRDVRAAEGEAAGHFGPRAGHRRREDVEELRQHAGGVRGPEGRCGSRSCGS